MDFFNEEEKKTVDKLTEMPKFKISSESKNRICQELVSMDLSKRVPALGLRRAKNWLAGAAGIAVVAVVGIFVISNHSSRQSVQTQNANATKSASPTKPSGYDYQSLLGFTPMVLSQLPSGSHTSYTSAAVIKGSASWFSADGNNFEIQYADQNGNTDLIIDEFTSKQTLSTPPSSTVKVNNMTVSVYENNVFFGRLGFEWQEGNLTYKLSVVTNKINQNQGVQMIRELTVPYTKKPMNVLKQYHSLTACQENLPFTVTLPNNVPSGYEIFSLLGTIQSGKEPSGSGGIINVNNPGTFGATYVDKTNPNVTVSISEKVGTQQEVDAMSTNNPIKIGSMKVMWGNKLLEWYDPLTHVVTQISTGGSSPISQATLQHFARAMIVN